MIDYGEIAKQANEALISIRDVDDSTSGIAYLIRDGEKTGSAHNPTFAPDARIECNGLQGKFDSKQVDGERILSTDLKITLTGLETVPTPNDKLEWNSKVLQIMDVMPLAPAGVAVFYVLQCRG